MPPRSLRDTLGQAALEFVLGVVWPRTLRRRTVRQELRLALRKAVLAAAMLHWVLPHVRRRTEEEQARLARLREELGREPTTEEKVAACMRDRDDAAGRATPRSV